MYTPNRSGLPIIEIPLREHERIDARGADAVRSQGIYVTLAAYPLVPKAEVGFRVQLTAANTDAEVDSPVSRRSTELAELGELQSASESAAAKDSVMSGLTVTSDAHQAPEARQLPLWQRTSLRRRRHVPLPAASPFKGSEALINSFGLTELDRRDRRHPSQQPRIRAAVVAVRVRVPPVLDGRRLHLQLPRVPAARRRFRSRRSATRST